MMKAYPEYKSSNFEWFKDVPSHWSLKKVAWDMPFVVGWTPSTKEAKYFEGKNIWVSIEDMKSKFIESSKKKISDLAISDKGIKIVPSNSLLFSFKLSVGKVGFSTKELYTNEAIASFLENDSVYLPFLYYAAPLFLPRFGQENIYGALLMNQERISSAKTYMPYIEEQKTIATYLDVNTSRIDNLIAEKENFIKLLSEKRQALISHVVTKGLNPNVPMKDSGVEWIGEIPESWDVKRFRHLFSLGKGLTITKEHLRDRGIPCVNYGEIHSKYNFELDIERHPLKYVDEAYLDTDPSSLISAGDFVFADTSEDFDGCGNFTHLLNDAQVFAGYHTIIGRLERNHNSRYISYFLDSNEWRNQIRKMVKGVKVFSISQKILKDTVLFLPSEDEQNRAVEYLDRKIRLMKELEQETTDSIKLLQEHRVALISAAVTGKIDVREEV